MHVERHLPTREELPLPELPDSPGRPYKAAYIAKQFFAWKYLWGYDRVAVIDDTCFVRPITPDIFSEVPHGYCGYTRTSRNAAEKSFAYIREFIAGRGEAQIEYDPNRYMNSGVMVYDTSMRGALSPDELARCADLLYSPHPDQSEWATHL